jgi:hypothetical protein
MRSGFIALHAATKAKSHGTHQPLQSLRGVNVHEQV